MNVHLRKAILLSLFLISINAKANNYLEPTDLTGTTDKNNFVTLKNDGLNSVPGETVSSASNKTNIARVATFSDWTLDEPGAIFIAVALVCDITNVSFNNISSCNDNGTNDPTDDYFTADLQVDFSDPPATGSLQLEPGNDEIGTYSVAVGSLVGNSHTFTGAKFKADGTTTVIEAEFTIPANQCVLTKVGPTVQPCSATCDITSVVFNNVSTCNDNGTIDPTDDYFTANLQINFTNPPATGNLQLEPGNDEIGTYSVAVGSLVGNSHTFTGAKFKADGTTTVIEAEFTIPANQCVLTKVGPTVQPCSTSAPANDLCANAINIDCGETINSTTSSATIDAVANCVTILNTAPGVWYSFTGDGRDVTLSLCGSGYDTKIGVFSGTCASLVCVVGNDDFCGLQSKVTFPTVSGTNYFVLVTGFTTNSGNFTLTRTCIFNPCSNIPTLACETPVSVSLSGSGVWSPGACGFSTPGLEQVYSFTPTITGVHNLDVISSSGGFVDYMYKVATDGCSATGWTCIDDILNPTVSTIGTLTAGTTYYILLDPEITGSITVTFQILCDFDDPCANILTLDCETPVSPTLSGSGAWDPGACGFSTPGKEQVYSFTPTTTGIHSLEVSATSGGFVDYFYKEASDGCTSTGWICIDDIFSPVTTTFGPLTAGTTYYILIDPETVVSIPLTFQIICPSSCILTCPADITKGNDANQCGAVVTYPSATTTGSCGTINYVPPSGSFLAVGPTTVSATATDGTTCNFIVTINDVQAPVITCPANITVSNDANQCGAVVNYSANASDNCPGMSISYSPPSGHFFPVGTTTMTATATDGSGNTSSCSITVTVNDVQPPVITCPANIIVNNDPGLCSAVVNYVVTASDNCPGVSIVANPASGSTFPVGTTTVNSTATDAKGNTASCSFTVTVNTTILKPDEIFGPAGACRGQHGVTYCITPLLNATYYSWTLPIGATGSSNGPCITVNFSNSYNGGVICVNGKSSCATGPEKCLNIPKISYSPSTPGSISGPSPLCPNICGTYSVIAVSGATSYQWSTTGGLIITSGQGTRTIIVCAPSGFANGSVKVYAKNCKGNSGTKTKNITGLPGVPVWSYGGNDNHTGGVCGGSTHDYEVTPLSGINTFVWSAPSGCVIDDRRGHTGNPLTVIGTDPYGEYEVRVTFPGGFVSGNITVAAKNSCGTGAEATLAVQSKPSIPGSIFGNSSVCKYSTKCFSISSVAGATSYTWTVNNGATIKSGQGSKSICVRFNSANSNLVTLTVKANNSCGSSATSTKIISVNFGCKTATDGRAIEESENDALTTFEVYPNPTDGKATVTFNSIDNNRFTLRVIDVIGKVMINETIEATEGYNMKEINLESVSPGLYIVSIRAEGDVIRTLRLIVE